MGKFRNKENKMSIESIIKNVEIFSPIVAVLIVVAITTEMITFGKNMGRRQKVFNFISVIDLTLFVARWDLITPECGNWVKLGIAGFAISVCFADIFYIPKDQTKRIELNILQFILLTLLIGFCVIPLVVPLLNIL